jgi:glycosyltransferase involved in cell wall biosynthesis
LSAAGAPAFCSIIAKNYLAYARVLCRSLRRHHPDIPMYVLVVDEVEGFFDPRREEFEVLRLADLDLPDAREMCFRYDVVELCTAVKPSLIARLLERGHEKVVFLDPDIRVYRPMAELLGALDEHSVLLTPHLTAPLEGEGRPDEQDFLGYGTYNLGFIGLARNDETRRLLKWWADHCRRDCLDDREHGLFVDQRWVDLVPGLFSGVHVLRGPEYNVAHWNLAYRRLSGSPDAPLVEGRPLAFFHFSGFQPATLDALHTVSTRLPPAHDEPGRGLRHAYARELAEAGHAESRGWSYSHGRFEDGQPIVKELRQLYRALPRERFHDPFRTGPGSFLEWATTPGADARLSSPRPRLYERWIPRALRRAAPVTSRLSPLARRVLDTRPDVRQAFATPNGDVDVGRYLEWLATRGAQEHGHDPAWYAAAVPPEEWVPRLAALYEARPALQQQLPMAFVAAHDARRMADWLEAHAQELGADGDLAPRLRALLASDPEARIREIHARREDLQKAFPRALEWPLDAGFVSWLRRWGRPEHGLSLDWITWFEHSIRQHVCLRLQARYREEPAWQRQCPDALGPFGGGRLLAWLREHGAPEDRALAASTAYLCSPEPRAPVEEARRQLALDPELRTQFPRAFASKEGTDRLIAWLESPAAAGRGIDPDWVARLKDDVAALGLAEEGALLIGYPRAESGMGELMRATTRALAANDYRIAGRERPGAPQHTRAPDVDVPPASGPLPFTIAHLNACQAAEVGPELIRDPGIRIAYCTWELGTPPLDWPRSSAAFDEVWTMSRFSASALAPACAAPVQVMWPALRMPVAAQRTRADFGLPDDAFVVLSMLDLMSEVERKNPAALVRAFGQAFAGGEKACLVLKVSGGDARAEDRERLRQAVAGSPVVVIERWLPADELAALMATADVFASLHRAEGFGLTLAEAMALGKPVVATHYSGNVDFMTPWNSCLVPYSLVVMERDHGPYRKGSLWADPDVAAAGEMLRGLHRDPDRARRIGAAARDDLGRQFSAGVCGARMVERLRVLAAAHPPGRARGER